MSDTQFLSVLMSLVAALFGIIIMILGWLGNKMYSKLDEMNRTIPVILAELAGRVRDLDRRVSRIETHVFERRGTQTP